jgi:hypothetical protein
MASQPEGMEGQAAEAGEALESAEDGALSPIKVKAARLSSKKGMGDPAMLMNARCHLRTPTFDSRGKACISAKWLRRACGRGKR